MGLVLDPHQNRYEREDLALQSETIEGIHGQPRRNATTGDHICHPPPGSISVRSSLILDFPNIRTTEVHLCCSIHSACARYLVIACAKIFT